MATYITLRRNVEDGVAPRKGEPVAQAVVGGWVLKVGDGTTPVEDLPVMAGPGAYASMEEMAADAQAFVTRAEAAATASATGADRAEVAAQQVAANSVTFSLDPANPDLLIASFPAHALTEDGNSIIVPVTVPE